MYEEMKMVLTSMECFEKVTQKIVFLLQNPDLYKGKLNQIVHIPVMNLVMLFAVPYQADGQMKQCLLRISCSRIGILPWSSFARWPMPIPEDCAHYRYAP